MDERRALCTLYLALAKGDAKSALAAAAPCGLVFGDEAPLGTPTAAATGAKAAVSEGAPNGSVASDGEGSSSSGVRADQPQAQPVDVAACLRMLYIMFDTRYIPEADAYSFGGGCPCVQHAARTLLWPGGFVVLPIASYSTSAHVAALGRPTAPHNPTCARSTVPSAAMVRQVCAAHTAHTFHPLVTGGDVVEGAPLASFPGPLYLVCRAILILRGLVSALKLENVRATQLCSCSHLLVARTHVNVAALA